jgi:AcrR family transcriptional regulator
MLTVLKNIKPADDLELVTTELTSLASFIKSFPLQGESLYSIVFNRNGDIVQTQKARFAVANLEKILSATFAVSATSGFDRMSLRDLSRQTGMSMGSIYSCISKKEDIALMIADIVRLSSELTRQHAMQSDSMWSKIEQSIRFHLYASTLLQPWYFFLYFETRCLPEEQQRESKQIELDAIKSFEAHIQGGMDAGEFHTNDARMVANTIVVLLEDWYLKPWKTLIPWKANISIEQQEQQINNYSQSIIELVRKLLADS